MSGKLSSAYYHTGFSSSLLTSTLVDRIFRPNLLEQSCEAVIDFLSTKQSPPVPDFDVQAKSFLAEHIFDLVKLLCTPFLPASISDLVSRVSHSLPEKLRPSQKRLDEFRLATERGARKWQFCIPADKIVLQLRTAEGRMDTCTATFFVLLVESILRCIVQATFDYRSKITKVSGSITVTDIQHIISLLGITDGPSGGVKTSLPFIHRRLGSYEGCLKDLQCFLNASGDQLAMIIRVFYEPLNDILTDLARMPQTVLDRGGSPEALEPVFPPASLCPVARSASTALAVLNSAKSLFTDMSILSEAADDAFDNTSHMLKYCLQEPAEEDLFQGFAYYADTFFGEDCNQWISVLSETPSVIFALHRFQGHMVRTILEQVSLRRAPEMELRFVDPHICNLCRSINDHLRSDSEQQNSSNSCASSGESSVPVRPSDTITACIPVPLSGALFSRPLRQHHSQQRQRGLRKDSVQRMTGHPSRLSPQLHPYESSVWHVSASPSPPPATTTGSTPTSSCAAATTTTTAITTASMVTAPASSASSACSSVHDGSPPVLPAAPSSSLSPPTPASSYSSAASSATSRALFLEQRYSAPFGGGSKTCSQMVIAFRYFLPRLLLMPAYQILYLADLLDALCTFSCANVQEQAILREVSSMLYKTRKAVMQSLSNPGVEEWTSMHLTRLSSLLETPLTLHPASRLPPDARAKLEEVIQSARSSNETIDCHISASDFIMSGTVQLRQNSRTELADRAGYLFTDCLLLFKRHPQPRRGLGTVALAAAAAAAATVSASTSVSSPGGLANSAAASMAAIAAGGISLKKCIPLFHFHLIDLGMEVLDSCETLFLFELEYWKEVNVVKRPVPQTLPALPGAASERVSATMPTQASSISPTSEDPGNINSLGHRNPGSSITLVSGTGFSSGVDTLPAADVAASSPVKRVVFCFRTADAKADWLGTMIALQTKRLFRRYLRELPKQEIPLVLPDPEVYCFTRPDTVNTIQFERPQVDSSAEIPVIKAATITKLIERMTYHAYYDSKSIRTFLQTYRRFLSPHDLLDLLIKRFNMPRPDFEGALQANIKSCRSFSDVASLIPRMELRFHSAYKRRIQYRVLSLITKWVRDSAYFKHDFSLDNALKNKLLNFLQTIETPALADSVATITKCLRGERPRVVHTIVLKPPERLDLGLIQRSDQIRLTNVHPLELARQVTLHEWELYSKIEFWEVNGKDKSNGPNLKNSLEFSNKFQRWLVLNIMSHESMEDRVIVLQRVADLLLLFDALNNFQGIQEARAAVLSAPVYRLRNTFDVLMAKSKAHHRVLLQRLLASDTDSTEDVDSYMTDYHRRIHCIDPPAVPFIAVGGRTQLIHLEHKVPNYVNPLRLPERAEGANVPSSPTAQQGPDGVEGGVSEERHSSPESSNLLINFFKCQQIADLVEHYLSFQNTPFNLQPDPVIQELLENLDPLGLAGVPDEAAFEDLMFQQSLAIQPREQCTTSSGGGITNDSHQGAFDITDSSFVVSRPLSATEIRVAALLNAAPIYVNMVTDSKEFKQLVAVTSSAASVDAIQSAATTVPSTAAGSFSHFSRRGRGGSLNRRGNCENSSVEASSTLPSHRHSFHSPFRECGQYSRPMSRNLTSPTSPPHNAAMEDSVTAMGGTKDPSTSGATPPPQSCLILPPPIPPKLFTRHRRYFRASPTDLTALTSSLNPDRTASDVSSGDGDSLPPPPLPPHRLSYPERLKMCLEQPDYLPAAYPPASLGLHEVFDNADRIFLTGQPDSAGSTLDRGYQQQMPLDRQASASSAPTVCDLRSQSPFGQPPPRPPRPSRQVSSSSSGVPADISDFTQFQGRLTPMSEGLGGLQHLPATCPDIDLVPPLAVLSDRSPELPPRTNRERLQPPPPPPLPASIGRQPQGTSPTLAASVDASVPPLPPRVCHHVLAFNQEDWLPPVPPKSQGRGPHLSPSPHS
ncbi:hypothetical protein SprV_0401489200 [Sparganum proliferum]